MDGGETWQVCTVNHPEKPNKYGKFWCWCFWSLDVEVLDLLGAKEIAVRAWDETLNTQPEKLIWNLLVSKNGIQSIDKEAHVLKEIFLFKRKKFDKKLIF